MFGLVLRGFRMPMPTVDPNNMRTQTMLVLLACFVGSGCLEMEQTICIEPDGSGTQKVVLEMTNAALAAVQVAAEASHTGRADPQALFDRKAVSGELAEVDLKLLSHETKQLARGRRVSVEVGFDSPGQLRSSPLSGSMAEW